MTPDQLRVRLDILTEPSADAHVGAILGIAALLREVLPELIEEQDRLRHRLDELGNDDANA